MAQIFRTGLHTLLQARRECSAAHELLFESRGEAILFGKAGRKIAAATVVPAANFLLLVIFVKLPLVVFVVFTVTFAVALGAGHATSHEEKRKGGEPSAPGK